MREYAWICLNIIYQHPVWNLHENKLNLSDLNFLKLNYWNFWILGRCSLYIWMTFKLWVNLCRFLLNLKGWCGERAKDARGPGCHGMPWDAMGFQILDPSDSDWPLNKANLRCSHDFPADFPQLRPSPVDSWFQLPPFQRCSGHEACWVNILKQCWTVCSLGFCHVAVCPCVKNVFVYRIGAVGLTEA